MPVNGSFNYAYSTQRENDYREGVLASGFYGVSYITATISYGWNSGFSNLSQTVQIRDSNNNAVASGSGSGLSGSFTISAYLNPTSTYYFWGSASSFGGAIFAYAQGYGTVAWTAYYPPQINQFTASPNPQTSGTDGIPNYNTTLNWSTSNAFQVTLTSSAGESWDVTGITSKNITNLSQSTAGSNSPSTRTYTLTASQGGVSATSSIIVQAYNDNTPSNSWTTSFTNLDPNLEIPKLLGTLSGIDMITKVSCPTSGVFFANGANGSYANPQYFSNGQNVYIKMTSLPFNTDVSGVTGDFGKTNTKTVSVTVGSSSAFNVSYVTRKPRISEDFDYDGQVGSPFEDIDFIDNTPTSTLVTQTLNMDNIEIPMEIKGDNPDLEIKINNGSWQSIREI